MKISYGLSLRWTLIFIFISYGLIAQVAVTGTVLDAQHQPVGYANVLVFSTVDSSLVKGAVSTDDGRFSVEQVPPGHYWLRVSMMGYEEYNTAPFDLQDAEVTRDMGQLVVADLSMQMQEVQVIAKKPLFERKIDRMVVNVANSITSSGITALQVLERSPGVIVNHQSNMIAISGKTGVVVMINGRINYMPQDAVVRMLEGMSSDNIERIEIITTPPAGLDAEGNAGYINIVLKQNLADGFNGSYSMSLGYGKGETAGANLNFNLRQGKVNLYGDYSYLHEAQEQTFDFYRRILLDGDQVETSTISDRDPQTNNHMARLGLDYQLTPNTVIGGLVSGYDTKWTMDALNHSWITINEGLDTIITIQNDELNQWKHLGGNLNIQHTFSEGNKLTLDLDVLGYKDNNPVDYANTYYDGEGVLLFQDSTRSRKVTPINIRTGKVDYTTHFSEKIKMETGAKVAISHFTNDVGVDYNEGSGWVPAPGLTARYDLDENIYAAYVSVDATLSEKWTSKFGLRYEWTDSNLGSETEQDIVDRSFGQLFPTAYLSRKINENQSLWVSYGKRITRPTFKDMAPFTIFLDPNTFFSGNPALQPAISHNFELGYQFKSALISVKYSMEDSAIANFQGTVIEGTNIQLISAENLQRVSTVATNLSFPITPVKWWNINFNINGYWQEARKYDEGQLSTYQAIGVDAFNTHTITLPHDLTFEVSAMYGSGGLFGIFLIRPYWAVNAALQKKFGERGGSLRLGCDDIFNSLAYSDELELQDEYYKAYLKFSQRTLKLTYTRNFGDQNVEGSRRRETSAEEEKRRVN